LFGEYDSSDPFFMIYNEKDFLLDKFKVYKNIPLNYIFSLDLYNKILLYVQYVNEGFAYSVSELSYHIDMYSKKDYVMLDIEKKQKHFQLEEIAILKEIDESDAYIKYREAFREFLKKGSILKYYTLYLEDNILGVREIFTDVEFSKNLGR